MGRCAAGVEVLPCRFSFSPTGVSWLGVVPVQPHS
jgi:hypothetical protein